MKSVTARANEKPLPPIRLRELPHWALALFFVYVLASNYDPFWILEPPPGQPAELIEPARPIRLSNLRTCPAPTSNVVQDPTTC